MELTRVGGNIVGLPVRGSIIKLNDADGAMLLRALAGTIKGLCVVGAGALGLKLFEAIAPPPPETKADPAAAIAAMAKVELVNREFIGVCVDQLFDFECDGHTFSVPLDRIAKIHVHS